MRPIYLPVMSDGQEPSLLPGPLRTHLMNCFQTQRVTRHSFVISMDFQKPAKWTAFTAPDQAVSGSLLLTKGLEANKSQLLPVICGQKAGRRLQVSIIIKNCPHHFPVRKHFTRSFSYSWDSNVPRGIFATQKHAILLGRKRSLAKKCKL